jgi:hypothetical protein
MLRAKIALVLRPNATDKDSEIYNINGCREIYFLKGGQGRDLKIKYPGFLPQTNTKISSV